MIKVTTTTLYRNGDTREQTIANSSGDSVAKVYFHMNNRSEYSIEVYPSVTDWIDSKTAIALSSDLLLIVKHCDAIALSQKVKA